MARLIVDVERSQPSSPYLRPEHIPENLTMTWTLWGTGYLTDRDISGRVGRDTLLPCKEQLHQEYGRRRRKRVREAEDVQEQMDGGQGVDVTLHELDDPDPDARRGPPGGFALHFLTNGCRSTANLMLTENATR